ncbi:MAG: NAD(P)/FAD-dependent oxidoreductase [Luteolibacter sp.]
MSESITITGGGLTGLSLAIALRRRGVAIILHEAGHYPRHRICGEFISGVSPETLDTLGITSALDDAGQHRAVAWFSGNTHLRDHLLPTPALAISRYLLDDRLQAMAVDAGVELHTGSRRQMRPGKSGEVWTAGRKPVNGTWIGLKAHVRGIHPTADLEMHGGPRGYLGITAIEDGWHNVCGLFRIDRTIQARHAALLPAYLTKNGNTALARRIAAAEWRPDSFTAVAGFALGLQAPTKNLLSLGDSHAIIPPFTGNGMTMAFQSAEIAVPHLTDFAMGIMSWNDACAAIANDLARRFSRRLTTAKLLHPLLFHTASRPLLKHAPLRPIVSLIR